MRSVGLTATLLLTFALGAAEDADLTAPGLDGKPVAPFKLDASKGQKAAVLIFIQHECPIANAYAPEIKRLCEAYAAKGFVFYAVHVDPDLNASEAKKHAGSFSLVCAVLLDDKHALAKRAGVKVAPEAAVIAPEGKILYRGRIDDLFAAYGKKRAEPTSRDLRNALDAIAAGQDVPVAETQAVGCPIESFKRGDEPRRHGDTEKGKEK